MTPPFIQNQLSPLMEPIVKNEIGIEVPSSDEEDSTIQQELISTSEIIYISSEEE